MTTVACDQPRFSIKTPTNLSSRIQWLRDYYFQGVKRTWNNEYTSWTTGTPWDFQYNELSFYIVPETYTFLQTFRSSYKQVARPVSLHQDFWKWSLPERRAWFNREVMLRYLPREILPGDLLAGARFNVMTSACLSEKETRERDSLVYGPNGSRAAMLWFHNHGYGNVGATSGHLIPDYGRIIREGWKAVYAELEEAYAALSAAEQQGKKGGQLRAMITAASMPRDLAAEYAKACRTAAELEPDSTRRQELLQMADNLQRVPWEPAHTFWEGVQSLWLTHMLVMADENYPGPGDSFGRLDQYLFPLWEASIRAGMPAEFGKEILKCFWIHCNTAYDGMIRTGGNQGITAGYGQLFTISGMGPDGQDMSNDLTYILLDVIDEMSPILEPKPNVRLHRGTPDKLLDRVVEMVASSQGSPFLLNFDERSMAGMMLQARKSGVTQLINENNVFDYAPVGCLENTMVGNDRSGTVDANLNLLKAVELALTGGYDLLPFVDAITGKVDPPKRWGADTGEAAQFQTWEQFWEAYTAQTRSIIRRIAELYEQSESIRARFAPTPYVSCLVRGCAQKGLDITEGGAELGYVTIEAVTYATTVDSLLAVKYLVYDQKICTAAELIQALRDNWVGHEVLQARALHKAPKYGRDDDLADEMGRKVMELWTEETWKYRTLSTGRQFRPGMLSWNYWVADSFVLPASADGRPRGKFLSNALCPSNGADINGPTANVNSVGKVLGGKAADGKGDWGDYLNLLPNGGSHTMTFNPSILRDLVHREKFKAFLRGYIENGGSALQINLIDPGLLRDAQKHPENYRHLLVRVTGYNAYFTSIGRELQDEIIAREESLDTMNPQVGRTLHLQRLSTEDGPGIRTTVFFKGCPLHCAWCHNPESISNKTQLQWFEVRCLGCNTCLAACPDGCLSRVDGSLVIDRKRCLGRGACAEACPANALELLGKTITVDELVAELLKDRVYFEKSGGGVTLSGGEPTLQPEFTEAILRELKSSGISTALDTCGLCTHTTFDRLLPFTDLLLYDLKLFDPDLHRQFTGSPNRQILDNLLYIRDWITAQESPTRLWIRTPLIPGTTTGPENLLAIGRFLSENLDGAVSRWELCAFNNLCRDQYIRLGVQWAYAHTPLMTADELAQCEQIAQKSGVNPEIVQATGAARLVDPQFQEIASLAATSARSYSNSNDSLIC